MSATARVADGAAPGGLPEVPRLLVVTAQATVAEEDGGGSKRPWHLMRGLERNGVQSTMWSLEPELDDSFAGFTPHVVRAQRRFAGHQRRTIGQKLAALASPLPEEVWMRTAPRGAELAEMRRHDAVMFMGPHGTQLATHAAAAGLPIIFDAHDVPDRLYRRIAPTLPGRVARWRTAIDSLKWSRYQRRLVRRCSLVMAVSEADAEAFRRLGAVEVVVRPNGVDTDAFAFVDHARNVADRVLFVGQFSYLPNLDAARWLTGQILPALRIARPGLTIDLVGRGAPRGPWPDGVSAVADVPEIQPWFDAADLLVVPLRAGGGTRIKIVEAFAKGLPVVSTSIGCEGLPVRDGEHLLVADTTEGLTAAALRLLTDTPLRARLAANARQLVLSSFDWAAIGAACAEDVRRIIGAARLERYHRSP